MAVAATVIVIAGKDPALIDGGMEAYLRAYGRAALRAGYEPHHFCVSARPGVERTDFGIIHRARSPFRPFRGLMVAAHEPFVVDCVDRFVGQQQGPHLVHSFGPWSGVGVAAARRLRKRGIEAITVATAFGTYNHETRGKLRGLNAGRAPMVWLQHWWELLWTRLTVDPSERRGYTGSRLVLVNYDSVRDIISAQFGGGICFGKMTYSSEPAFLKEGVERTALPDVIAALEPRDAPLVVCVSRHDLRKGVDVLLHALADLRGRGVRFRACVVGGGLLLDAHRRLAERLGLAACTTVPGRVPDAYSYIEHADVFVLPSLEEGSGSVSFLEAMQAGAASVISRVDGLPEDATDGENALLVAPGDRAALAAALGQLLSDAELRARISRGARRCYRERFSADAFATDLRQVYTGLGFAPSSETAGRLPVARPADPVATAS
jgi:glycosyltransferase involved in cell wall biosynthesis